MTLYHDREYLKLVERILTQGIPKSDRTGTGTLSLPFQQMRFNLCDGSIPLLTTKKMHVRSVIHELLWYLQGNTSNKELERYNVSIWREWADEQGELGKIYGHQWRNWDPYPDTIIDAPSRIINQDALNFSPPTFPLISPNVDYDDSFIGTEHETQECGKIIVLDLCDKDSKGDHTYKIQFLGTGYIKENVRKSVIKRGHIIDVYLPRVYNVGYLGEYDKDDPNKTLLQRHWYKILERCYDSSTLEYHNYGAQGIFVHPHWHCFANFQHDVKYIPNWNNKRLNPSLYELDKDYYRSNCYSKETCVWLTIKHNTLYRRNPQLFVVTTPDGHKKTSLSVSDVCNEFDLTPSLVYRVLNGKRKEHKGFNFEYLPSDTKKNIRYSLPFDQIGDVIHKLRTNPTDRRIIVNAWNVSQLNEMRLPPCHLLFQFWSDGAGELRCHLYQRSCDVGLGVPFNIVQYSILTHMIAHVTGHTAVEFVWTGGDVHIYNNHINSLREQLLREPYQSPRLELNPHVKEVDDFTYDDIQIVDYFSHPAIKMDVSV